MPPSLAKRSRRRSAHASRLRRPVVEALEARALLSTSGVTSTEELDSGGTLETAMPLTVPVSINEQISPAGDVDLYRFTAAAGETLGFDIDIPTDWWSPYLRIFDAGGWELPATWRPKGPAPEYISAEQYVECTFEAAGTYYVGVSAWGNDAYDPVDGSGINTLSETGGYTLNLSRIAPQFRMESPILTAWEDDTAYVAVQRIGTQGSASVDYTITGLTAQNGVDFEADISGTLWFDDGQDYAVIQIMLPDNGVAAPDKTLRVDLHDPSTGWPVARAESSTGVFILDNDGNTTPTLYCPDTAAPEGTADDASVQFTVYFSREGTGAYSFDTIEGTAHAGDDYYTTGGSHDGFIWYEQTWELTVNGDSVPEPDEDFFLSFNPGTNLNLGNVGPVLITLLDDDSAGPDPGSTLGTATPVSIGGTISEFIDPDADVDLYAFTPAAGQTIRMRATSDSGMSLYLRLFDSSGSEWSSGFDKIDYTFWTSGETYYLGVSGWQNNGYDPQTGEGAMPADQTGSYTLQVADRHDFLPEVWLSGTAWIVEPETGQATVTASFHLDYAYDQALESPWHTGDYYWEPGLTATAGADYEAASGVLFFEPGQTEASIQLTIHADALEEGPEQFLVWVEQPEGSTWGWFVDIYPPDLDDQISEAAPLTLGTPTDGVLITGVDANMYSFHAESGQTLDFDLDAAAEGGLDYSQLRLFAADGTPLDFSIGGYGPGEDDSEQPHLQHTFAQAGTYFVGIGGRYDSDYDALTGENHTFSYWTGSYVLLVTDASLPTVSIHNAAAQAGTGVMAFTVSLSHAYNPAVQVDFVTADGSALAGADYALTSGTLTFAPGQTSQTILVPILASSLDADKSFSVSLSNARSQVYVDAELPWADSAVPIAVATAMGTIQAGSGSANQVTGTPGPDQYSVVADVSANLLRVFRGLDGTGELAQAFLLDGLTSIRFIAGGGDDTVAVFDLPAGVALSFDGGEGNDTLIAKLPAWAIGAGATTSVESFLATDSAVVNLDTSNAFTSFIISGNAAVRLTGIAQTFACADIDIAGTLDLAGHELLITPPPDEQAGLLAQLNNWAGSARNATPLWSGPGITSIIAAADPLWGVAVIPMPAQGQILVKCTLNGDMDGSGGLDGDDYFLMDVAFLAGLANPGWRGGDFNYDQVMDGADYLLADAAFLGQPTPISVGAAAAPMSPAAPSPFRSSGPLTNEDVWGEGEAAVWK